MIKRNAQDLRTILKEIMDENSLLKSRIAEQRVLRAWNEVLGEGVAKYTTNLYFKRGVLFVQLSSSVLRAELMMNKKNLIDKLNKYAEMDIIRDIVLR
ncbi:MAG: DUF721 domain-containing protein [Dysgonamonadaceae bacterium]|jgi:predicted nucleic acid-binding Zn ribbon protein